MSSELKKMNVGKDTIGNYINDPKLKVEAVVLNKFPHRFSELEALLKSANFNASCIYSAHKKLNLDLNMRSDDDDGNVSKKRK